MWSAACGQAAEDLEFFVYRAVDVRRRWSCACLLVLFCRCVAPDHALCLVSVLSAYSLQASCVVFEALRVRLWVLLARRGDERVFVASSGSSSFVSGSGRALEVKTLGEPRALSRRHVRYLLRRRARSAAAARAAFLVYWECVVTGVAAKPTRRVRLDADPRRQCFGLQYLR